MDDMVEDRSFTKKLKEIRDRYAESFTVHGMNHIVAGNIPEKLVWIVLLLGALSGTVLITHELFGSYLNNEVSTKINIKQQLQMKLPTIYICASKSISNFQQIIDCSSSSSQSFDFFKCSDLSQECPEFCDYRNCLGKENKNEDEDREENKNEDEDGDQHKNKDEDGEEHKNHDNDEENKPKKEDKAEEENESKGSCPSELHGQCIVLNANGNVVQSYTNPSFFYRITNSTNYFPLEIYVVPPGERRSSISLVFDQQHHLITRKGKYNIYMEKKIVKRLPPPYTKCIQDAFGDEAKNMNMFVGPYNVQKCLATCDLKRKWYRCKTTFWTARDLLRNKTFEREDRTEKEIKKCLKLNETPDIDCENQCLPLCYEELYKVRVQYAGDFDDSGNIGCGNTSIVSGNTSIASGNRSIESDITEIEFVTDREETSIVEEPKQSFFLVLSAFGGTLGLLAGVSVLSLVELLVWLFIAVVHMVALCFTRKIQPAS